MRSWSQSAVQNKRLALSPEYVLLGSCIRYGMDSSVGQTVSEGELDGRGREMMPQFQLR